MYGGKRDQIDEMKQFIHKKESGVFICQKMMYLNNTNQQIGQTHCCVSYLIEPVFCI